MVACEEYKVIENIISIKLQRFVYLIYIFHSKKSAACVLYVSFFTCLFQILADGSCLRIKWCQSN